MDPWTVYHWWGHESLITPEDVHWWLPDFLGPDAAEQARRDLSWPQPLVAVHRWTWERLLADPAALRQARREAARYVGTRQWFTPHEAVQIVLLPTSTQWLAPAWFNYFGATEKAARIELGDDPGRPGLAAAIRQWEHQWGAELVAFWGTMLQFVAGRQPALGEQAWQLAVQHLAVGGSLLIPPWKLALALTESDGWLLHDRP